ncbi:helix-turn-helix domain-containing protein [uncultured Jannaschia sp.]|uniref:helix-turn-helix domain-containing protein n=1 Tax=uncultured Jannaschia sp. TaxID=293347 RepID=UPI00263A3773|nr:helix-turn-helix domain-containing protein [uncultured Jannaschia sp.]
MTAMHAIRPHGTLRAGRPTALRTLDAGETLFREADAMTHLFELRSGVLRLTRFLETGRRQVVAFAYPGDIVGFPAGRLHHSDCEALTPATVAAHRRAALDGPGADPGLHDELREAALAEIVALQDHLMLLARIGARGKLASFLLHLMENQGTLRDGYMTIDLPMPRADIADYLCTTVETVSRALTQLRRSGAIRLDGIQRVVLLDRDRLAQIAGSD